MTENLRSCSLFNEDKKKITITPRIIKNKCLKKKEQSLVFSLSEATKEVETNEKNKPVQNNSMINKNKNLSIFFHH